LTYSLKDVNLGLRAGSTLCLIFKVAFKASTKASLGYLLIKVIHPTPSSVSLYAIEAILSTIKRRSSEPGGVLL
jgi:Na+/H+ antiporter NhaC